MHNPTHSKLRNRKPWLRQNASKCSCNCAISNHAKIKRQTLAVEAKKERNKTRNLQLINVWNIWSRSQKKQNRSETQKPWM